MSESNWIPRPTEDGWYFMRATPEHESRSVYMVEYRGGEQVEVHGKVIKAAKMHDMEFQGPLKPKD